MAGSSTGSAEYDVAADDADRHEPARAVKHLASVELGYLGPTFGAAARRARCLAREDARRSTTTCSPAADESREDILGLYRRAWAHGAGPSPRWSSTRPARCRGGRPGRQHRHRCTRSSCTSSPRPPGTRATPTSSARSIDGAPASAARLEPARTTGTTGSAPPRIAVEAAAASRSGLSARPATSRAIIRRPWRGPMTGCRTKTAHARAAWRTGHRTNHAFASPKLERVLVLARARQELRMSQAVLDGVRDLLPTFRERADEAERLRVVPEASIKELEETGFFRLLQPKRFDGSRPTRSTSTPRSATSRAAAARPAGSPAWSACTRGRSRCSPTRPSRPCGARTPTPG